MRVLRQRATVVWIGLVLATCASTWVLSLEAFSPAVAVLGIFVIAAVKVWFVMQDFMELRTAPTGVRVVFGLWILIVTAVILGFWFATPTV
jgi:heme/copper-type cytochrome/quinol oxidase subunit 4